MKRPIILVVDDDADILHGLRLRLNAAGYDVRLAQDGISAVQLGLREQPDLVVLDLMLPGTDGLGVLARFQAHPSLVCIPVIMLSSGAACLRSEAALRGGACAYMEKPYEDSELLALIARWLARKPSPASNLCRGRLLLVDNDADFLHGLSLRLKAEGFEVACAADGYGALARSRQVRPDLVLMDVGLPGPDGLNVVRRLHALEGMAHVPVVVLSAQDRATHASLALAAGAVGYLEKPVDDRQLIETILRELPAGTCP